MQCALDTQNLSRPFPITWKWALSRVLFWLPLLENRDSQNNSGQSWCCLLFHSINVPKMWSTPNSKWSSLWVFWHYNLLGCDLEKCHVLELKYFDGNWHFQTRWVQIRKVPALLTCIFLTNCNLSSPISRQIFSLFNDTYRWRQTIMSLKKTNFY
jgi:hypothetical protein